MAFAYISLGSNLGDKKKNLEQAIEVIKQKCSVLKTSVIYESKPVGNSNQPNFYNQVIKVETKLSPPKLLKFLLGTEEKLGRVRSAKEKNNPRTIDLDIIFYDDEIIEQEELIIPHPRMHERSFVLKPLLEMAKDYRHPKLKETVNDLWIKLKNKELVGVVE